MFVEKVITGLRIYDPGAHSEIIKPEPYFVFEGLAHEAVEFLGVLQAPPHLMHNLVEWLMPEYANEYVLLVSLDGKRGFPFARKAVEFPSGDERVTYLGVKDNFSVHELKRLVREFKLYLRGNQELAIRIGVEAALNPEKRRVRFTGAGAYVRPGSIDREIQEAIRNLESATDDALVWLAIAGPDNHAGMYSYSYDQVMREITLRQTKNMEFRSTFFPLDQVTMHEILERQRRAEILLQLFTEKCRGEHGGIDHVEADAWIKTLDTDQLGELAVRTFYAGAGEFGGWKYFVPPFQARMPKTIIY